MTTTPVDRLVVLDVGHGSCAVLHDKGQTVVVDAGTGSTLLEYLTKEGISTIDLILLSHADEDHIGGVVGLLSDPKISIRKVCVNSDAAKRSKTWDDLLYELDIKEKLTIGLAESTPEFSFGDTTVHVLAPSSYLAGKGPGSFDRHDRRISSNSVSAVLRLSHKGKAIAVFTGDIDEVGLDNWFEKPNQTRTAPVLIFPHHGGGISGKNTARFTQALLDHVKPSSIVFSIGHVGLGQGLGSIRPNQDVVGVVRSFKMPIRIICTQISKHCAKVLPTIKSSHFAPVHAHGKEDNRCCAGSIVIDLDNPESILPDTESHCHFINCHLDTPICVD